MLLHVAALAARVVLELAPGGVERVAQGDLRVLVAFLIRHNLRARHLDVEAHVVFVAVPLVARGELDHDPAADDVVVEVIELRRPFPDRLLQGVRVRRP